MSKKKLLLTGASGLLGSNLLFCLRDRYDIVGITYSKSVVAVGVHICSLDLGDAKNLKALVDDVKPDIVIHAAAEANVDKCEENPDMAYQSNVQMTTNVVAALHGLNTKLIYISTDLVYDGKKGNFSEADAPNPINVYGKTKLAGERVAMGLPRALALRTNFFGWNTIEKRSFAEWGIDQLKAGNQIKGFKDAIFSSIYTKDMADLIDQMIFKDLSGVYNFGSSTCVSKYEFLVNLAKKMNLDATLITPILVDQMPLRAPRCKDLSLNMAKLAKDLNVSVVTLEDSVAHFIRDYKSNERLSMINILRKD